MIALLQRGIFALTLLSFSSIMSEEIRSYKGDTVLDHVSFSVSNYIQSLSFYDETLRLLGIERLMNFDTGEGKIAGYGIKGRPSFWISYAIAPKPEESIGKAQGLHIAFRAPSVKAIQEWHKKCLELGGIDNGAPSPRPQYHPGYYGAFIIDPNGWKIEASLHDYKGQ